MPWLVWQGLTQVLCPVCCSAADSSRAVQRARQNLGNVLCGLSFLGPFPGFFPPCLCAGALRALVSFLILPRSSGTSVTASPALAVSTSVPSGLSYLSQPAVFSIQPTSLPALPSVSQPSGDVQGVGLRIRRHGERGGGGGNLTFPSDKSPSC